MTLLTSPADGRPPAADSLIAAARHLGQVVVADSLTASPGSVGERLALSAVVLGAAERQMLDAQNELAEVTPHRQALAEAARITAQVACGDGAIPRRLWLGWRAAHLLTQLDTLPSTGGQDAAAVKVAADATHAAALILQAQVTAMREGPEPGALPAAMVAQARSALTSALQALDSLDPETG
jgi:hypothetical protein